MTILEQLKDFCLKQMGFAKNLPILASIRTVCDRFGSIIRNIGLKRLDTYDSGTVTVRLLLLARIGRITVVFFAIYSDNFYNNDEL